jgi:hypothetical protein
MKVQLRKEKEAGRRGEKSDTRAVCISLSLPLEYIYTYIYISLSPALSPALPFGSISSAAGDAAQPSDHPDRRRGQSSRTPRLNCSGSLLASF